MNRHLGTKRDSGLGGNGWRAGAPQRHASFGQPRIIAIGLATTTTRAATRMPPLRSCDWKCCRWGPRARDGLQLRVQPVAAHLRPRLLDSEQATLWPSGP